MEPKLVTREAGKILGIQKRINPMAADYVAIWQDQYMPHDAEVRAHAAGTDYYGVYFPTETRGEVEFVAGMLVENVAEAPQDLVLRNIPAGQYAVFECSMSEIATTWQAIYESWLPGNGRYVDEADKPPLEVFPPGVQEDKATVSIAIPVRPKEG